MLLVPKAVEEGRNVNVPLVLIAGLLKKIAGAVLDKITKFSFWFASFAGPVTMFVMKFGNVRTAYLSATTRFVERLKEGGSLTGSTLMVFVAVAESEIP